MICEIVLNNISRHTDNIYNYIAPDSIFVSIGSRVLVPFGRSNKPIEGYVIGIVKESSYENLKEIISCVDNFIYFNDKMAGLIKFLHHRYFSPYRDILKAVLPRGVSLKMLTIVHLIKNDDDYIKKFTKNSLIKEKIILELVANGGCEELSEICANVGRKNITSAIRSLEKNKLIYTTTKKSEGQKDKLIKMASLDIEREDAYRICEILNVRAKAQARIMEVLCENEAISVSELVEICDTSTLVLDNLVKKGFVKTYEIPCPFEEEIVEITDKRVKLTSEQDGAVNMILDSINKKDDKTFLIHGVTGSGKTEVYLNLISRCIDKNMQSLFLVPEIALTPQMVSQVKARFGSKVAVMHSMLTVKKRYDEWKRIKNGEVFVVVGARSAVFSPLQKLGLIIIDEEHEGTYKSESTPRYHTIEVARYRAKHEGATLVLASATPSLESYYRARSGVYNLIELTKRVNNKALPKVSLIDMRKELENGNMSMFSNRLKDEISKNLERKEQTILFLNKRGFSSFVSCRNCGYVPKCPNCDISLTYHKSGGYLVCHYCDYKLDKIDECPKCKSKQIRYFGVGTQKVTEEIQKVFPNATFLRMDADTTAKRFSHEEILNKFRNDKIDILVGTQMIAKGLDLPNVTLVGVIAADLSLFQNDFRACEKTFSLLTQVVGRAGRGEKNGRAIVQTYYPENDVFKYSDSQDFKAFYENEILIRRQMMYPPFCEIINFTSSSTKDEIAYNSLLEFRKQFLNIINKYKYAADIFGVTKAPMYKINNKYRYRFIVKMNYNKKIYNEILLILKSSYADNLSIIADVNPISMY